MKVWRFELSLGVVKETQLTLGQILVHTLPDARQTSQVQRKMLQLTTKCSKHLQCRQVVNYTVHVAVQVTKNKYVFPLRLNRPILSLSLSAL